jgi:excisionase family DNA binding protein
MLQMAILSQSRLSDLLETVAQRCDALPRISVMVLTPAEADKWQGKWSLADFMFVVDRLKDAALLCDENGLLDGAKRLREFRAAMIQRGPVMMVFVAGRHAFDRLKQAAELISLIADIGDYARSLLESLHSVEEGKKYSIPPEYRTRVLTNQEAARYLGLSAKQLRERLKKGTIRHEKNGRQSLIVDLREFQEAVHAQILPEKNS